MNVLEDIPYNDDKMGNRKVVDEKLQDTLNKRIGESFKLVSDNLEKVQILEIKQIGIMNALDALYDSKAWGDVTGYDIVITKTKTGPEPMNVEYSVVPEPKKPVSKKILEAYDGKINLEALFEGEDPFSSEGTDEVDLEDIPLQPDWWGLLVLCSFQTPPTRIMKKDTEKKVIYTFDEMKKKPVKAGVIVDGNIFHKKVKNEHYMVKEHGYGIQRDVIEMLALKGVGFVYIHAKTVVLKSKLSMKLSSK